MKTNRAKYEHYRAEIAAKDAAAIAALIPDGIPAQFFTIKRFDAVPSEVTGVGIYRRGIYAHDESDRVTRAEVELAMKCAEEWAAPSLGEVSVHYREKSEFGTVTGAHPYTKIDGDKNFAWSAEDLEPEIQRRRELYAPRDGHKPCGYCQKQTPEASLISATIYYRDRGRSCTKTGMYCSGTCSHHDQCAHEG